MTSISHILYANILLTRYIYSTPLQLAVDSDSSIDNIRSAEALGNTIRLFLDQFDFSEKYSDSWLILRHLFENSSTQRSEDCDCIHITRPSNSLCRKYWPYTNALTLIFRRFLFEIRSHASETLIYTLSRVMASPFIAYHEPNLLNLLSDAGNKRINTVSKSSGFSVLHGPCGTERQCEAIKAFIRRGENIHLLGYDDYLRETSERAETPLSLVMRSSISFHFWRKALQESNVDLGEYVLRACQEPPMIDDRWTEVSLQALFRSSSDTFMTRGTYYCGCCGQFLEYPIEVRWQRMLENVKAGQEYDCRPDKIYHLEAPESADAPLDEDDGEWEDFEEKGSEVEEDRRWQDQYEVLCWHCWKHLKGKSPRRRKNSHRIREIEDSSDEEDSPFLLSLRM